MYRGFRLIICNRDVMVVAPDGDLACFPSMSRCRLWVKRKRKELER